MAFIWLSLHQQLRRPMSICAFWFSKTQDCTFNTMGDDSMPCDVCSNATLGTGRRKRADLDSSWSRELALRDNMAYLRR